MVGYQRTAPTIASGMPYFPHGSFQTHEARIGEHKNRLDDQMEEIVSTDFRAALDIPGASAEENHDTDSVNMWKAVFMDGVVCSEAHFEGVLGAGGRHVFRRNLRYLNCLVS